MNKELSVLGRAEKMSFIDGKVNNLPVKIDTGAYRSSIWATNIYEKDGKLHYTLLGPSSKFYSGQEIVTSEYRLVKVENSFGHKQERYSVFLRVKIGGKSIRSNFTLANRSVKKYPALIGRKLLKNRFVVDVSQGDPIKDEEVNDDRSLE